MKATGEQADHRWVQRGLPRCGGVASSPIEVLPVIHAQRGRLVGPDAQPIQEDLREVARRFSDDWEAIYLVDLDGLSRNKAEHALVQELAKSVPVWADAGPRSHKDVMDLLIAGAEQVTIRYETATGPETLEEAVRLSENVALGLEFQDQELVQNPGWPSTPPELVSQAERLRVPIVVVDLDRAGTAMGVDRSVAWHGRSHASGAYFAGGVAKQRDLEVLKGLGYQGALVSTALLEGARLSGEVWAGPIEHQRREDEDTDEGMEGVL